jgi:hypothetical protein
MADVFRPLSMNVKRLFSFFKKEKKKTVVDGKMTSSSLSTRRFFFFLFLSPAGRPIITLRRVETTGVVAVAGFLG